MDLTRFARNAIGFPEAIIEIVKQIETPQQAAEVKVQVEAVAKAARQMQKSLDAANKIAEGYVIACARVGELCPPKPGPGRGHKKRTSPSEDLFAARPMADYRKLAKVATAKDDYKAIRKLSDELQAANEEGAIDGGNDFQPQQFTLGYALANLCGSGNGAHVSNNSGEHEWYTPPEYADAARNVMGTIELDPASSKIANQTIQADRFFTKQDDGLSKPWRASTLFCNPPYEQPAIAEFTTKLIDSIATGDVQQAIYLVNNATDTEWFCEAMELSPIVCFVSRRIKFLDPEGNATGAPLQGQAIAYYGNRQKTFAKKFGQFGFIAQVMR